jgi:hypothetical protein
MASIATTIATMVQQRDAAFVARIATDYNLNVEELTAKYLEVTVKKIKKATATVLTDAGPKCTATTAKKEQCKFSALGVAPGPGQQRCKATAVHLAAHHLFQHIGQPSLRINTIQDCRADQRGGDGPILTATLTACE